MAGADRVVVGAMVFGLLLLASGVILLVYKSMGESNVPLEVQLVVFGILIVLFTTMAGKVLSRD